jgi:hypothetical protein
MGPIEHALIAAAYRLSNGAIPAEFHQPVDPALDCMTQALHETCRLYGFQDQDTARFLMSLALRVGRLNSEIPERHHLREVEAQLMATCGLLDGNGTIPPQDKG